MSDSSPSSPSPPSPPPPPPPLTPPSLHGAESPPQALDLKPLPPSNVANCMSQTASAQGTAALTAHNYNYESNRPNGDHESGSGRLTVVIKRASGLVARDVGLSLDAYVLLTFGEQHRRTRAIMQSLEPAWNEAFVLSCTFEEMEMSEVVLSVMDEVYHARDALHSKVHVPLQSIEAGKFVDFSEQLTDADGTPCGQVIFNIEWSPPILRKFAGETIIDLQNDVYKAGIGLRKPVSLLLQGTGRAVNAHLADWAEVRVQRGLARVYKRLDRYLRTRSEIPETVAPMLMRVLDRTWEEVREPVSEYMSEEFGKVLGARKMVSPRKAHKGTDGKGERRSLLAQLRAHWLRTMYPYDISLWQTMRNPWWWPQVRHPLPLPGMLCSPPQP